MSLTMEDVNEEYIPPSMPDYDPESTASRFAANTRQLAEVFNQTTRCFDLTVI